MKTLLLTFTLLMGLNLFAQDLIIKKDQTEVKAKVIELTDELIKYNKYEMLDGPIYSIKNSEVFMIVYKNGTKEYISKKANPTTISNPEAPVTNSNQQFNDVKNELKSSEANIDVKQSVQKSYRDLYPISRFWGSFYGTFDVSTPNLFNYSMLLDYRVFDSFCLGGGYSLYFPTNVYNNDVFLSYTLMANYKMRLGKNVHIWPGVAHTGNFDYGSTQWMVGANWYFFDDVGLSVITYEGKAYHAGVVLLLNL